MRSRQASQTQLTDETREARRVLAESGRRREAHARAIRRPVGWLRARTWRDRQRVKGWLLRRLQRRKTGAG